MGNIFCCIFLAAQISVGASGAPFGFIGVLFVDLATLLSFLLGMMPYVDNFAHLGGFVEGVLASALFLPELFYASRAMQRARLIIRLLAVPLQIVLIADLLLLFYMGVRFTPLSLSLSLCSCRVLASLPPLRRLHSSFTPTL
jgi:hypothetical protein